MIYINLLSWREAKRLNRSKTLLKCLLIMLTFSFTVILYYWRSERVHLRTYSHQLEQLHQRNHSQLSQIENMRQMLDSMRDKQWLVDKLNRTSQQRQTIPIVLHEISSLTHSGRIHLLQINQQQIVIKGEFNPVDGALVLFQVLSQHPALCQATFQPVFAKADQVSASVYVFQAQLCDESA